MEDQQGSDTPEPKLTRQVFVLLPALFFDVNGLINNPQTGAASPGMGYIIIDKLDIRVYYGNYSINGRWGVLFPGSKECSGRILLPQIPPFQKR
jgi:hypothetical protein